MYCTKCGKELVAARCRITGYVQNTGAARYAQDRVCPDWRWWKFWMHDRISGIIVLNQWERTYPGRD